MNTMPDVYYDLFKNKVAVGQTVGVLEVENAMEHLFLFVVSGCSFLLRERNSTFGFD